MGEIREQRIRLQELRLDFGRSVFESTHPTTGMKYSLDLNTDEGKSSVDDPLRM